MKNRPWLQAALLFGALLGSTISSTNASTPTEKGDCDSNFEGVQFEGAKAPNGERGKIQSAEACIDLCKGEAECRFWTWIKGLCLLFKDLTREKPVQGAVSGDCLVDPVTEPPVPTVPTVVDPNLGKCLPVTPGQKAPLPRIMLIGETGVGKSTLGLRLLGKQCGLYASTNFNNEERPGCAVQKLGHQFKSETNTTTWIAGKWLGGTETDTPCFAVVDTPGIGDTGGGASDCTNFMGVAKMAREISPIDAFVLVIRGDRTRVGPKLVDQLRFFEELFGQRFWKSTVIAVSFWKHSERDIRYRKDNRKGLDENKMAEKLNVKLKRSFHGIPTIPAVFVDPVFDEDYFFDDEAEIYARETAKLWKHMVDSERFFCGESCISQKFFQGSPKLEDDIVAGGGVVSQYMGIGYRATMKWTIWFGDCDQNGIRSYTVLKNNETIYEMVEAAYLHGEDWEPGTGRPTARKPPSLQIVDSCNTMKAGSETECDNKESKYKTITLTFDPITESHFGKYKLQNERGVSEEAELVKKVDGKAGPWSEWGPCSITCIGDALQPVFGFKERTRTPTPPVNGGKPINASLLTETKHCASPTNSDSFMLCEGKPLEWSPWGPCTKSCGPGGQRERRRSCSSGRVCPKNMETEERTDCSVDTTTLKDWTPKCPKPSRYGDWSEWSCASRCFNPLKRAGTSQTRTRTCTDDEPEKHTELNCQTMSGPLEDTLLTCLQDPYPYKTRYGETCLPSFPCDSYGEDYYWCRYGSGNGDWDFCSADNGRTRYGESCYSSCAKNGEKYYWCRTHDSWDYCSPRC